MRPTRRPLLIVLAALVGAMPVGCCTTCCEDDLCYETAWDLSQQNQSLAAQHANTDRHANAMADEAEALRERNRALEEQMANLRAGQGDMERRYPGSFEFDPATGISKFNTDILFETGKDDVRPDAQQMLQEFASILNDPEIYAYNVMVVGHTDDQRIARETTRAKHPTNWHLSAHRAIAVEQFLNRSGIADQRMGVAGYGPNQPLVPNDTAQSRQLNRRVEIFVLAPDSVVAGRTASNPPTQPVDTGAAGGAGVAQPYIDQ